MGISLDIIGYYAYFANNINIFSNLGAIYSIFIFSRNYGSIQFEMVFYYLTLQIIGLICAKILYDNARSNKINWALLGLLGNINAIFIFSIKDYIIGRWTSGRSIFR